MSKPATLGEVQTVVSARRLTDATSVFISVGRPSAAAILARMVHNPELVLVYESGTVGAKPTRVPLSIGDGELAQTADFIVSVPEMFNYWIGAGRIQMAFLGAAQVDRFANLNSTVIGDYEHPRARLPGRRRRPGDRRRVPSGDRDRAAHAAHVRRTARLRTTVGHGDGPGSRERLGFRGAGPSAVITTWGCSNPIRRADN